MSSEQTPLLRTSSDIPKHDAVYNRFTRGRKKVIVALVSWAGLMPLFVSGSFIPTIPQIAADLDTTGTVINFSVSLSVFSVGVGSLTFATYSGFYGRRPIYLFGLPIFALGSLGVGFSQTIPQLMVMRFLQGFGASGGLSVGSAVIGDIYKLEERGTAMGVFFAACLLGPAIAPFAGGVAAHFGSWRDMQIILSFWGLLAFSLMFFFFPETCHPMTRGVDKLKSPDESSTRRNFVWLNPLGSLWILRSPNLLAVTLAGFAILLTDYVLLLPLAYTIGARYNITNEALIGACFLPAGLGNIIGAPVAGRLSDRIILKWRIRRGGIWVPEDRLRATLGGALILVPLSVLACGLVTRYVDGSTGLALNLVFLFMNGLGVDIVLSPAAAYLVDVMHSRSAETMAANNGLRSVMNAFAIAGVLPCINLIGFAATCALAALFAWIAFGLLWCTIRYGDRMRACVDVGFSTEESN